MKKIVNDHKIRDYDKVLDKEFGAPGTYKRAAAEERAYAFYGAKRLLFLLNNKRHRPSN